ncbi:MAG: SMP-30/gluconolactonase/LRE family protein [Paracoccaceae bacterium]
MTPPPATTPSPFTCFDDCRCELSESPVWDARTGLLYWVDIPGRAVYARAVDGGETRKYDFEADVGSIGLTESGKLVVACGWSVLLFDPAGGTRETIASITPPEWSGRLNDGKVGPDGAFWVGAVHGVPFAEMEPVASLYRVTPGGVETVLDGGLKVSNSLAWSPDGSIMYHGDSIASWVKRHRFSAGTGAMSGARPFISPAEEDGRPDGAAVDMDGNFWSAGVSAGVLNCYAPDGTLLRKFETPAAHPTMPCFGGADMRTLYLTSHRQRMTEAALAAKPMSGSVFEMRVETPGAPVHRFQGA